MTRLVSRIEAGAVAHPSGVTRADAPAGASPHTSTQDEKTTLDGAGFATSGDIRRAWASLMERHAERHRRPPTGIDGIRSDIFEARLEENLAELGRMLNRRDEAGRLSYTFAPWLLRSLGSGSRSVHIPRMRDQVVLRLMAERIGRAMAARGLPQGPPSQEHCARFLRRHLREQGAWFLRADIRRFYESAPHAAALHDLAGLGCESGLTDLVARIFATPARPPFGRRGDERTVEGYPAGVSVSSLLAELVLARIDGALHALGVEHLRYVDDFLVVARDGDLLERAEKVLTESVEALGMQLSASKMRRGALADGVTFLGLQAGTGEVRLSPMRVERWLAIRQRELRDIVTGMATLGQPDARSSLAGLIARWNAELSGARGRFVAVAGAADDKETLSRIDRQLRMMLAGVMRRLAVAPEGAFRLTRAEVWGQRWRCAPSRTRIQACRRFGTVAPG